MPEVSWSLMHPVKPDPAYLQDVIAAAAEYHVDSFEVCGEAHSSQGSMDGAIRFRDYPAAAADLDLARIDDNLRRLRETVALAHASGRPVLYWHREVMVPRRIVESIPGLLDANGEFDLLGTAYQDLLRSKVCEFFDGVPEMDGLVLTLTESDYSVIHNSDPDRYPPRQVVAHVVGTFGRELKRLGKRFVLRSFGSIAQDYEDILGGAELVPDELRFEIETKITPYDFSPFLPLNPYLRKTAGHTVSAEYDSIGEFLGAGFLPAADPARVIECVRYAQEQGVSRHVIRVDRIGHPTFASTQAINLLAFERAIRDPRVTIDAIWREWAAAHWPGCADEMSAVMQRGIAMVKKTHFIDGHVIFHAFPIQPELKWIKACGILSVFRPGLSLANVTGMWGILPDRTTPSREALLREKDEAVALADEGLTGVMQLRTRLTAFEYELARNAWRNATVATRAIRHWCRCICAYFEDIEEQRSDHPRLDVAMANAQLEFERFPGAHSFDLSAADNAPGRRGSGHEYGDDEPAEDSIDGAYLHPTRRLIGLLPAEYDAEFKERAQWRARAGVIDFVVCGGLFDDGRVQRYMHASHARLIDGRPARLAGNRVFPNGFIEVPLALAAPGAARIVITGDAGPARKFRLTVDGRTEVAQFSEAGEFECALPSPSGTAAALGGRRVRVRIQKHGADYPAIYGIATVAVGGHTIL